MMLSRKSGQDPVRVVELKDQNTAKVLHPHLHTNVASERHHVVIPFSICLHFCVCACSKWYSIYLALRCVPQKLQASIEQAQVACQQYKMVRQKSQRFLKPSNKP